MKYQRRNISMVFGVVMFFFNNVQSQIYVDQKATSGKNDGSSWENAFTDFQSALDQSVYQDTIWVAEGVYHPTQTLDDANVQDKRNRTFHAADKNLIIYGGFSGSEKHLDDREIGDHVTTFSGDFNNDDVISDNSFELSISNNIENAYHVFILAGVENLRMDGVNIVGGNADDQGEFLNYGGLLFASSKGGGIYLRNNLSYAKVNLVNCMVNGNASKNVGGGVFVEASDYSSVGLSNCLVSNNISSTQGGGLYATAFAGSTVNLNNSMIFNNSSYTGGGVYSLSAPYSKVVVNNSFISNNSAEVGGGIFSYSQQSSVVEVNLSTINENSGFDAAGGILSASEISSKVSISNSSVSDNSAFEGGGILSESYDSNSSSIVNINNSSIINNLAHEGCGVMSINYESLASSIITVEESIIWTSPKAGSNLSNNGTPKIVSKGNNIFSNAPVGFMTSDSVNVLDFNTISATLDELTLADIETSAGGSDVSNAIHTHDDPSARKSSLDVEREYNTGDHIVIERRMQESFPVDLLNSDYSASEAPQGIVVNTIGLEDYMGLSEVVVRKSPNSNELNIIIKNLTNDQYVVELIDGSGRTLSELLINNNSTNLNIDDFEDGVFLLRISNRDRHSYYRVIKNSK